MRSGGRGTQLIKRPNTPFFIYTLRRFLICAPLPSFLIPHSQFLIAFLPLYLYKRKFDEKNEHFSIRLSLNLFLYCGAFKFYAPPPPFLTSNFSLLTASPYIYIAEVPQNHNMKFLNFSLTPISRHHAALRKNGIIKLSPTLRQCH